MIDIVRQKKICGLYTRVSSEEAYINEIFNLAEYNEERKKLEVAIEELHDKLNKSVVCEVLKFTPEDILIKRDIDFINGIKYPKKYKEYNCQSIPVRRLSKD